MKTTQADLVPMDDEQKARVAGEKIILGLQGGLEVAAESYKEYIVNGGCDRMLRKLYPNFNMSMWNLLRAVSEKRINLTLAAQFGGAIPPAILQLSIKEQDELLKNGVELLTVDNESSELKVKAVTQLSLEQSRQVFASDHIRTQAEQRLWLDGQKRISAPVRDVTKVEATHLVKDGKLTVLKAGTIFTQAALIQILGQMTKGK